MQNNYEIKLPWLDKSGELKSLDQLKKECENWTIRQWNEYLMFIDFIGREETVSPQLVDRVQLEDFTAYIASTKKRDLDPNVKKAVNEAIKDLTVNEYTTYKLIYVNGLSTKEVAQKLKVSPSVISERKRFIFNKVKQSLISNEIDFNYSSIKNSFKNTRKSKTYKDLNLTQPNLDCSSKRTKQNIKKIQGDRAC